MLTVQELAERADASVAVPPGTPTIVVTDNVDVGPALDRIGDVFGENPDCAGVHLIVGEESAGFIAQADLDDVFLVGDKGIGDSAGIQLPGHTPGAGYVVYEFRCPQPGCPAGPVFTPVWDASRPLHCLVHPDVALEHRP